MTGSPETILNRGECSQLSQETWNLSLERPPLTPTTHIPATIIATELSSD